MGGAREYEIPAMPCPGKTFADRRYRAFRLANLNWFWRGMPLTFNGARNLALWIIFAVALVLLFQLGHYHHA